MKIVGVLGVLVFVITTAAFGQDWSGEYGVKKWTLDDEKTTAGLIQPGGFFDVYKKVLNGSAPATLLKPFLAKVNDQTLEGTTIRDSLVTFGPAALNNVLIPILQAAPAGEGRDFALLRRESLQKRTLSNFNLSLFPVRLDLLTKISMVLPNFEWNISYRDEHQMTIQVLEKNFSSTIHLRWIEREGKDIFDTAKLAQIYQGFSPQYVKVALDPGKKPTDADLTRVEDVPPVKLPSGDVWEQIQTSPDNDSWQIYAGRNRYYFFPGKVLVVMISTHVSQDHVLADKRLIVEKLGLILDSLQIAPE